MRAALALALLLLPGLDAAAVQSPAPQTWPIDPARSQAQFSVRKFWVAHERGTFPQLQGTLRRIDTPIDADLVEVDATLDVAGLRMDDPEHRARVLGPDFFDVARYPWIRFDSDPFPSSVLATGGTVHGMLTLHGERRSVALTLQPSDCPRQPLACVIRAHGAISRSAFGMHAWRGVVSNRVDLDLHISLGDRP
jgi:polyisoprenoid-binding protein YceI